MNSTITYEVSPELQKAGVQAAFRHVGSGRMWIWALVLMACGVLLGALSTSDVSFVIAIASISLGLAGVLLCIKWRQVSVDRALDALDLYDDKTVSVTFTDDNITIELATYRQQTAWSKVTRIIDTGDFLILMSRSVGVGSLPKEFLSEEQITFIKSKVNGS